MITRQKKEEIVAEVKEKIENSQAVIVAGYRGITVGQMTSLRAEMRKAGCEIKVIKNTLAKLALNDLNITGLDEYFVGPTIVTFAKDNPVDTAKILKKFNKEVNEGLEIKAVLLEGKVIDKKEVENLASLPSREVLIAKVLGGMQAPLYGFAGVLSANLRNLVYVLEAIRKKKEEEAA
ncbi:50S ribosomal protein L10 [Peptococcaceae bacterium]|nr:50S ribosomal protein L10 [Peptococcaceae bacterium]